MTKNIFFSHSLVDSEARQNILHQKGGVLWLTGLSGSGKSTIAKALEKKLIANGKLAYVLDGDNVRHGLNCDLGFSEEDRVENLRRIAEVSALFADAGVITITAFISPYRESREIARSRVPAGHFFEVFINTPLAVCEERDPKGLYKKARNHEIDDFTGIDAPYEVPMDPDIMIHADTDTVEQEVESILFFLKEKDMI